MVIDDKIVITGSFNWTVTAVNANQENLIVVDNPYYINRYNEEFEKLWLQFAHMQLNCDNCGNEKNQLIRAVTLIQRKWVGKKKIQDAKKLVA